MTLRLSVRLSIFTLFLAAAFGPATRAGSAPALQETERLRAITALERVYYQHRIWPKENTSAKPAFESL